MCNPEIRRDVRGAAESCRQGTRPLLVPRVCLQVLQVLAGIVIASVRGQPHD